MGVVVVVDVAVVGVVEIDVAVVGVDEVGGTPCRACQAWGHVGDEGTRRCCQYRTCEDRDQHEPCEPESDEEAEEISVIGRCVAQIFRRLLSE